MHFPGVGMPQMMPASMERKADQDGVHPPDDVRMCESDPLEMHIYDVDEVFCAMAERAFVGTSVHVHHAPLASSTCDAIVHAGNAHGVLVGGQDRAFMEQFGPPYQMTLQTAIEARYGGEQPANAVLMLPMDHPVHRFVIHANCFPCRPDTAFVALGAVLLEIQRHNAASATLRVHKCACSGLGLFAGAGCTRAAEAAEQMRAAWNLHSLACSSASQSKSVEGA
mmetsp:Transcript_6570/g.17020  ORF Transcript_6570/g.17020 Transcript_6570/m.17020 type:complete len:224 (-) Transcript_6570:80-751(-)